MFMFDRPYWQEHNYLFAQSYPTICPTVRTVGYSAMVYQRLLTPYR